MNKKKYFDPDKIKLEHKYLYQLGAIYIIFFVISKIFAAKFTHISDIPINSGIFVYSFTYILLNTIIEIYGYQKARQFIAIAIFCNLLLVGYIKLALILPYPSFWKLQDQYQYIFGQQQTYFFASTISYIFGSYINCREFIKFKNQGKSLYLRFLFPAAMGMAIDHSLFLLLGLRNSEQVNLVFLFLSQYSIFIFCQLLFIPFVPKLCSWLIHKEMSENLENTNYNFRLYNSIAALFVFFFIAPKILAAKFISFYGIIINVGSLAFCFSYIFSDILTEVYGYQRARQLIWFAIFCNFIYLAISEIILRLPSASFWHSQEAYNNILGNQYRIILASAISYLVGDFTNCFVIAKLKLKYLNSKIWLRFISSTAIGVSLDVTLCILIAFIGIVPFHILTFYISCEIGLRIFYETLMSPLSVRVSNILKFLEKTDTYDETTNFTPFSLKIKYKDKENKYTNFDNHKGNRK